MTENPFGNDWDDLLKEEFGKPYYLKLREFLEKEYAEQTIYPQMDDLWTAFKLTPFNQVKVVILGQDPYHGPGQAHGLSFSVQPGVKIPPSLTQYIQRAGIGYRLSGSGKRDADRVGTTRCTHAKHGVNSAARTGPFTSQSRMGNLYG